MSLLLQHGARRRRRGLVVRAAAGWLGAAVGAAAATFQPLPGQRIWLKGDSIAKGYAFGNYTDPSPLRTIDGIATILLRDNLPQPPRFGVVRSGRSDGVRLRKLT
jgi:hypothetical protein